MSRHRNMRQMIQEEDYFDDDYDDDYYDDYDDAYTAPPVKSPIKASAAAASPVKSLQQGKTKKQQSSPQPKQKQQQQQQPKPQPTTRKGDQDTNALKLQEQKSPPRQVTASLSAEQSGYPVEETVTVSDSVTTIPPILLQEPDPTQRTPLTLVILGHVDAGKSTITGNLLYHAADSTGKQDRIRSKQVNYAWILDEDEEERAHGITMDIATKVLQTATKFDLILQDAPGHADYVPAAITGAAAADAALLTVGSTDFRASFGAGQLREHALLARGLGVNSILVAVNKMDLVDWKKSAYDAIVEPLVDFLVTQVGFAATKVRCVPVSGLTGGNIFSPCAELNAWYDGPTLWQALDLFDAPINLQRKLIEKPLRILVSDVSGSGSIRAKVAQGWVKNGDDLCLWPVGDPTKLTKMKRLRQAEENVERSQYAAAGEMLDAVVSGVDATRLSPGHILTRPHQRPPISGKCRARIWLLGGTTASTVLIKGSQATFHMHQLDIPCNFSDLVRTLNKDGTSARERPRALTSANAPAAIVDLTLLAPVCMEAFSDCRALGRFALRRGGESIAVGRILEIL